MQHAMMQLFEVEHGNYDCHVIRRAADQRDAPPDIRSYRNITRSSLLRFLELSGGYRTAYSTKGFGHENE